MNVPLRKAEQAVIAHDVLGCRVHSVTPRKLTKLVEDAVESREFCIIANHNLHSLYLYHHDLQLRAFFAKARWIHVDGMGVVMLGRALGVPLRRSARITYVDWLPLLLQRAADRRWRIFYLGSKPGVANKGAEILRKSFPELRIATAHGYFDTRSEDNEKVLEEIRAFAPDLLMVGMGMPRQEHWIMNNIKRLGSAVILPCGAAMDYIAGEIPTPPRWAGRLGLEWLYRLLAEPGRLWKRYLVEPWFLLRLAGTSTGIRSEAEGRRSKFGRVA